jgi:hypothetical protein
MRARWSRRTLGGLALLSLTASIVVAGPGHEAGVRACHYAGGATTSVQPAVHHGHEAPASGAALTAAANACAHCPSDLCTMTTGCGGPTTSVTAAAQTSFALPVAAEGITAPAAAVPTRSTPPPTPPPTSLL